MSRDRTQLRTSQIDVDEFAVDEFGEYLPQVEQSPPRSAPLTMPPTGIRPTVSPRSAQSAPRSTQVRTTQQSPQRSRASPRSTQQSPSRVSPIASPRASPPSTEVTITECPNVSTSNITMRPSGIKPTVSPRSQVVVSPRVTRERRARASPSARQRSTGTGGTRVSRRTSPNVPVVEKSQVASAKITVSPDVRKQIESGNLPYLDYRFDEEGGIYSTPSTRPGGKPAVREPVNVERPLEGVSASVERMVTKVDKGPVPALKDRVLGEFMTKAMVNKYIDYMVKDKLGEMQGDGTFDRAFSLTEETRDLLKLALESYVSAFLESGKMIASHKGKMTLGADDLMIIAQLPINRR